MNSDDNNDYNKTFEVFRNGYVTYNHIVINQHRFRVDYSGLFSQKMFEMIYNLMLCFTLVFTHSKVLVSYEQIDKT